MSDKNVTKQEQRQPTKPVVTMLPDVDVWEDAAVITLIADLPGVTNKGLSVRVDNDTLLIEGDASLDIPEAMEAVYAELRTQYFRRSFALSRELDTARIDAKLKDGVLTVTIPKAETAKPHRIEVRSG
jgi:HSP20 family molecular chaperone IbpA